MAKNFKINIKNAQLAEAIHLSDIKTTVALKKEQKSQEKEETPPLEASKVEIPPVEQAIQAEEGAVLDAPKIKARSRSVFDGPKPTQTRSDEIVKEEEAPKAPPERHNKTALELAEERIPEMESPAVPSSTPSQETEKKETIISPLPTPVKETSKQPSPLPPPRTPLFRSPRREGEYRSPSPQKDTRSDTSQPRRDAPREYRPDTRTGEARPVESRPAGYKPPPREYVSPFALQKKASPEGLAKLQASQKERLGPTGRHISDIKPPEATRRAPPPTTAAAPTGDKPRPRREGADTVTEVKKNLKPAKGKDFKDFKPAKKLVGAPSPSFDSRDRQGLRQGETEDSARRRRRAGKMKGSPRDDAQTVRPTSIKVRPPISIKDFASELKLKASELIAKLFLQGTVVTLNDLLEDETTLMYLGNEFGCEIVIDNSEEERIRITGLTIKDEIKQQETEVLKLRPPVVTFMGHVDHGKTSLIDTIRKSNRVSQEAGAITQHIGAFKCTTAVGEITILDTPGHEAFSAMRARGAEVTDIVVLVVAGDEGIKQQTLEALQHAKTAGVTIVVAINKSDKPNFNAETVYRQLSENDLLPEAWGGQTITVNSSAVTGEGIKELLEMLAIQAEVLELKANPESRARGSVIESEMHKGMGIVATILVQNGTLKKGDAVVFDTEWAKVKTMRNELGKDLAEASPSTPVLITGLSGLPQAGQEFIVVKDEKEAREIAETRMVEKRQKSHLSNKRTMDSFLQHGQGAGKKVLRLVLRADVQGSLEALKSALLKITSTKVDIDIVFTGIGEISESDVQLAAASKAVIIGFHNSIESHAESLAKEMSVAVKLHDIIYHAVDDVKVLMAGQLEKLALEVARGSATVLQTFKSSHVGVIAGCMVNEGSIHRNYKLRAKRKGVVIWTGGLSSLKRLKEDVREVQKGFECGVVLDGYTEIQPDDVLEFYEITYITQEL